MGACRLLGALRPDVEGCALEDLFDPGSGQRVVHFWEGFAAGGGTAGPFRVAGAHEPRDVFLTITANVVPGRHLVGLQPASAAGERTLIREPGVRIPSARERQILGLLAEGETDAQIAARLELSPATVQTHVRNAKAKLGARTRAQAVALALTGGLIIA